MLRSVVLVLLLTAVANAGEVIEIHDLKPPPVLPKPTNYNPRKLPEYSDEAFEKDAWTRAWLLLDVSATGTVTRFKFLKKPGYDLERIATAEAFGLTFEPARDEHGRAIQTFIIWGIEWPSDGWIHMWTGLGTAWPDPNPVEHVPCRGSGPMHLGSMHPVYRDCSKPDLANVNHVPWVTR